MGIDAQLMAGGRCVIARMRLQRRIFETPTTPIQINEVTFSCLGGDRAKCLRPRPLFQLPIFRILDCRDATAIEAQIHLTWQKHVDQLAETETWLRLLGTACESEEERSVLRFPVPGEDPLARARCVSPRTVILPGRGPLTGLRLQRVEDRVLRVDPSVESDPDLTLAISIRLRELARLDGRLGAQRNAALDSEARSEAPAERLVAAKPSRDRRPSVLLVGPEVSQQRACIESLERRGYRVEPVPAERDAIAAFDRFSPELVLADVNLGRSEGIDLIPSLRRIPGVEEVPVVLIDAHMRPERRDVARQIGAAGYLTYPIEVEQIAGHLARIVDEPRRRRFTRYAQKLSVRMGGRGEACLTTDIGRGGMFLTTNQDLPMHTLEECQLSLPQLGANLRVQTEILYQTRATSSRTGVGLRFRSFPDFDEAVWIRFLRQLQPNAASSLS
jgi:two-component system chemotaxis response regulator CheY